MPSLYQSIKELKSDSELKNLFAELKLSKGYELLFDLKCKSGDMLLVAQYTACAYDPESILHDVWKYRAELKKAILNDFKAKLDNPFWEKIIDGENEDYNYFVDWYYTQIQDYYFQAIITLQEVIEQQMAAARMKIGKYQEEDLEVGENGIKGGGKAKVDDDKYLKALNIQNTLVANFVENIKKLKDLRDVRLKQYERTDNAVAEEIYKNSGTAEQSAMDAIKLLKNKL